MGFLCAAPALAESTWSRRVAPWPESANGPHPMVETVRFLSSGAEALFETVEFGL